MPLTAVTDHGLQSGRRHLGGHQRRALDDDTCGDTLFCTPRLSHHTGSRARHRSLHGNSPESNDPSMSWSDSEGQAIPSNHHVPGEDGNVLQDHFQLPSDSPLFLLRSRQALGSHGEQPLQQPHIHSCAAERHMQPHPARNFTHQPSRQSRGVFQLADA
jgi:hypothetical protein